MIRNPDNWFWLIVALAGGWLLHLLAPVLTPFLAAALLAYLGDPLVDRLQAAGLSRTLAVVVVFLVLFGGLTGLVLVLVPLVEQQLRTVVSQVPTWMQWFQDEFRPWLEAHWGPITWPDTVAWKSALQAHWQTAGGLVGQVTGHVFGSGMRLLAWLGNLVLIPVVVFYLLRDWDLLVEEIRGLLPRAVEPTVSGIAAEADEMLGAFLRGQMLVMLALATVYSVGLWLAGLKLALLVGLIAGLVSFVPYLGIVVGIVLASIAMLLQTHEWTSLLPVLGVFGIAQVLEGMVLTPLLVGDRIGLHPVAVIFAVLAGGQLFGFVGVLLALPAAAVLAVVVRHAHQRYLRSRLYAGREAEPAGGD